MAETMSGKPMNILVTGAAGFVGSHLVPRLISRGHTVSGLTRYAATGSDASRRRSPALEKLQAKNPKQFQLLRCEDFKTLPKVLEKAKPEICIHLAGRSWVRESVGWPELYVEANYRTTVGLLEALRTIGCRRVVFASTVMIYGKDAPLPYMEDQIGTIPASPYGASKLACEVLLNTYRMLHKFETINLRLFSVYGPDLRQDCVPYLILAALMKGKPFTIFGDGSSLRDYIDVEDVLDAIEAACAVNASHPALNVGSGFGTSLIDLVQTIERASEKKAELVYKPAVPGELQAAVPDISLAMEKLHWEPKVPLEQGIERMVNWFKENEFKSAGK